MRARPLAADWQPGDPVYDPETHEQIGGRPRVPPAAHFTRERLAEIEPRLTSALVKGVLPRQGVGFLAGPSTSAKTFFAVETGCRVSRGEDVCGRKSRQAGVVYVAAEDANGVRQRVKAWRMRNGDHGEFQLIPHAPNLRDPESVIALEAAIREAAAEMDAENVTLGLIIVDTVSKAAPGADQNASSDMGDIMSVAEGLATRLGALVLMIAHTPKDETRGIAGWYGQFAGADAVIMCTRDPDDDKLRIATVAKLKNGQDGERLAFRLDEMVIGADEDGDDVTSCVVAFEDAPTKTAPKRVAKVTPHERIALTALRYVIDHGDSVPAPAMPGVRPGALAASKDAAKRRAILAGFAEPDEKANTVTVRWNRALTRLAAAQTIRIEGDLLWPL